MTHTLLRLAPAALLGVLVAGCATVPGDPYYYGSSSYGVYEQPGYAYGSAPVYVSPSVYTSTPVYVPAPVYHVDHDRRDWRDRDRRDRDHARDRAERERRDHQARRDQAERERRAAEDRRNRAQNQGARPPAPGGLGPPPHDWRSRQFSNNPETP